MAKKYSRNGVFDIRDKEMQKCVLASVAVEEVWGISYNTVSKIPQNNKFENSILDLVDNEIFLEKRGEILQLSNIFNVKTVDVGSDQMTIETTGESNEIESLLELLEPYGIIEVMRTGRVAVLKSNE